MGQNNMRKGKSREIQKVPTIEEIRGFKFVGNHAADAWIFAKIHNFILSDAPMEHKREAMHRLAKDGMGVDGDVKDEDVARYIQES